MTERPVHTDDADLFGRVVIGTLSSQLNERFGKVFSTTNLRYFRGFYLAFKDRSFGDSEFATRCVANSEGFMPSLGWSHYRVLMRVEHPDARAYYECEEAVVNYGAGRNDR
jgi:hypothetical protein